MYYGSQGSCGCGGNQGYPNYGYAYPYAMYPGYGYGNQWCGNSNYAIIIVLFILLVIIIGSHWGR